MTETDWERIAASLRLSPRQADLVRGCFEGLSEAEIASQLSISRHTVHDYMGRLYRKLRVSSRSELLVAVFSELRALKEAD